MKTELDQEIKPIDNLAVRYYQFSHDRAPMHPLERLRLLHDGAVLGGAPLDMPNDLLAFDQIFARAPQFTKAVMDVWYKSPAPANVKASRLHISRAALYMHWKSSLWYFRGGLHARGLTI